MNFLAKETGRTKTFYIQEAVKQKIDDLELIYLARQRSEDVRSGKSKTFSWEEVNRENDL